MKRTFFLRLLNFIFLFLTAPSFSLNILAPYNSPENKIILASKLSSQSSKEKLVVAGSFCKPSSSQKKYISISEAGISSTSDELVSISCPIIVNSAQVTSNEVPFGLGVQIHLMNKTEFDKTVTCTLMETHFSRIISGFTKRTILKSLENGNISWHSIPLKNSNTSISVECELPNKTDLHTIQISYPEQRNYDFAEADERFQNFLDGTDDTDGISYTLVDAELGTIHQAAFGDHDIELIAMLASTSKVPTAMVLNAIDEDPSVNFSISNPIENYLPWEGVYGDRTVSQLLSNTSGIPGLNSLDDYGIHICQFQPYGTLEDCGKLIYKNELKGTLPAGSAYDYGGSQWQLAGAIAEQVTGKSWSEVVRQYLGQPCQLEVFEYGNMWSSLGAWDGTQDSLRGRENPHIGGGAISNMRDYAKILMSHLRGGWCGGNRVLSINGIEQMQKNRGKEHGRNYGMGWRISYNTQNIPYLYWDPGAFGSVAWIDTQRGIGGYMAIDDYDTSSSSDAINLLIFEIIPLIESAIDNGRSKPF